MTPNALIASIRPDLSKANKDRSLTINAFIVALEDAMAVRRTSPTTAAIFEIDWLYHAKQELRMVKEMDKNQVALRMAELRMLDCDEDEKPLRASSLAILWAVGKALK